MTDIAERVLADASITIDLRDAVAPAPTRPLPPRRRPWFARRETWEIAVSVVLVAVSLRYLAAYVRAEARGSLWTDELYSILHYSGKGPLTTLRSYDAPNNHIFFNLLNSITPGAGSVDPLRARFWSIVAVVLTPSVGLYEFARRKWYLAGALLFAVFAVNTNWLELTLQARGYGILGLCAMVSALWTWRYLEDGRRRWLVGLAVASLVGTWSVPIFVAFAGLVWLLLLLTVRTRRVLTYGAVTGAAIGVVYLPVIGQLYGQFSSYGESMGEQYSSPLDVKVTLHTYLADATKSWLALALWGLAAGATVLVLLPDRLRVAPPVRRMARILVASSFGFLGCCLLISTALLRTTAFVAAPLAVAALASVAVLARYGPSAVVRRTVGVLVLLAALLATGHAWSAADEFRYTPIENWKGAAEYINQSVPAGTAVFSSSGGRPEFLAAYLSPEHPIAKRLDLDAFARGEVVVVDFEISKPTNIDETLGSVSRAVGETDLRQQRGRGTPSSRIRILRAIPTDSGVAQVSIDGVGAPTVTDHNLATVASTLPQVNPTDPIVITVDLTAAGDARSLTLVSPGLDRLGPLTAAARLGDAERELPASAVTRSASRSGTITVDLGDRPADQVQLIVRPARPGTPIELSEVWVDRP